MTSLDGAFAYAQARLQARLGVRPSAGDWQRIRASRDLAALLQAASVSPLLASAHGLTTQSTVHEAERVLRGHWMDAVEEIAAWQPPDWIAAMRWLRWLPYLPPLDKLARGGRPPDWMRTDAVLGPIVAVDPRVRSAALARTALAPLAAGFGAEGTIGSAWLKHWQSLWPGGAAAAVLKKLVRELSAQYGELAAGPSNAASESVFARIDRRLLRAFRRHPLSPVPSVAYLGLAALDLGRLRGAVASRALRATREAAA
jgi:hypothetical protein